MSESLSAAACRAHSRRTSSPAGSRVPSAIARNSGSACLSSNASLPRRSCAIAAAAARSAADLLASDACRAAMLARMARVGREAANAISTAAMM